MHQILCVYDNIIDTMALEAVWQAERCVNSLRFRDPFLARLRPVDIRGIDEVQKDQA